MKFRVQQFDPEEGHTLSTKVIEADSIEGAMRAEGIEDGECTERPGFGAEALGHGVAIQEVDEQGVVIPAG